MITQDSLQGHWQRDWIKAEGFEDHTTWVHWLQAGAHFADLRIPLTRPDLAGATCLADLPQAALKPLLEAEGFAGQITVQDNACTWHRSINWHGVPGQPDVGLMGFDAQGGLIEDGVHAQYRELWQSVRQGALRGWNLHFDAMQGVLIENDDVFLLGIGPVPHGTSQEMVLACESGTAALPDLHQHFESEYVLGRWDGAEGIAQLSTNPFQEGQLVLERKAGFLWHARAFDNTRSLRRLVLL